MNDIFRGAPKKTSVIGVGLVYLGLLALNFALLALAVWVVKQIWFAV